MHPLSASGKDTVNDAKQFIESVVKESLDIVNKSNMPDDQKRKTLSESVNKYLDVCWLAEKVFNSLGYNNLEKAQQERVKKYLTDYLLRFYAGEGKLQAMMGAKLLDINANRDVEVNGDEIKVTTKFKKDSMNSSTEITWVIDENKSSNHRNHRVRYVEIEGINQYITLRSEMKSAIGNQSLMEYIKTKGY